jgi:uncharacterized Zn finger protein
MSIRKVVVEKCAGCDPREDAVRMVFAADLRLDEPTLITCSRCGAEIKMTLIGRPAGVSPAHGCGR